MFSPPDFAIKVYFDFGECLFVAAFVFSPEVVQLLLLARQTGDILRDGHAQPIMASGQDCKDY